jgi:putative proteasome-type protease
MGPTVGGAPSGDHDVGVTYCIAMRLDEGLVFLSDTRTNAGIDNISTYRKLHVFRPAPDRVFVLQSAGNLATTQEVLDRIGHDLSAPEPGGLATVERLYEAALYVGRLSTQVAASHRESLSRVGADGTSSFILGGQIGDEAPDIHLVYPEGNYIRASDDLPYLQIGETKYGKLMLDLAVYAGADLDQAVKMAVSSMISTARANLSVGPPYDLGIYRNGTFEIEEGRMPADSPSLAALGHAWLSHLVDGVHSLPPVVFEDQRREGPATAEH